MKILFITDLYPVKDDEKTTPRTLYNFVKNWKGCGHEVNVIKPNFIFNSFLRRKPFYRQGNYNGVLNLNFWLPFTGKIKKPEKEYNLVIAHMPSGILYADKLQLPFIAGIHSSDLTVLKSPLYKIYFKKRMEKALENAKAISCRSYVLKEKFLKLYPQFAEKTFAAPSGIENSLITAVQPDTLPNFKKVDGTPVKILTCANYKKRKNIEQVLKAVNNLEGFELTVIGANTNRNKLKKLNPKAEFKGFQPHKNVLREMQQSDIFILPSINESFGMVYLEAMACGCITICCRNDGIDGIIKNNENGFTTEPDVEQIRELLIRIKNMDANYLKILLQNSLDTIKQYGEKQCAENYLQQIFKIM